MKNCLKVLFTAAVLLVSVNSYALLPVSLGVKGGMNLSNFSGDLDHTSTKVGFNAGLVIDIDLPLTNLGLTTGVEFTTKGAKIDKKHLMNTDKDVTFNAMYLQLPIHANYKISVAPATKVVFHAGPYFAYGIGGKTKIDGDKYDTFDDDNMKRFDFGLGLGAGVQVWKFGVDLGWDFGLTNISDDSDISVKNRNAYLSVSYRFM